MPTPASTQPPRLDEVLARVFLSIPEAIVRAAKDVSVKVLPSLESIAKGVLRLPDELKLVVSTLTARGWFISGEMDMSDVREFQQASETADVAAVDALMTKWVESQTERIRESAIKSFPNRQTILEAAFKAHADGQFELAIPVLLIQVEGMCIEVLGKKMFATKNGVPKTKAATDSLINSAISEVIFLPLREQHGLTASEGTRQNWPDAPNRHEILHGIALDYATHVNSLKALSLIDYFVTLIATEKCDNPGAESAA